MQDPKSLQKLAIWAPSHNFVGLYLRNWGTYRQSEKKLLSSNISFTCPLNMVNFGPLTAKIDWRVWGTPSYFNGYRVLAALLHGTLLVGVSQTLRRWTEGVTYIRQGDHRVGHWPTFLVVYWYECNKRRKKARSDATFRGLWVMCSVLSTLSCHGQITIKPLRVWLSITILHRALDGNTHKPVVTSAKEDM